jgi:glucose-1-phosphate cytidylyltransferase
MKVVILAGGFGTRLSEETDVRPKPMVEICGKPILWHIMKIYSHYGYSEFIICLGYKGYIIKEYFHHYYLHQSDVTIDLRENETIFHNPKAEPWRITLVDTGLDTLTGGRVKRIQPYVGDQTFMVTYGDGVADINIEKLLDFHQSHGRIATVTAVQPSGRFGALEVDDKAATVLSFREKPATENAWTNGGFFVLEPGVFKYIPNDLIALERAPLEDLARDRQLMAFRHQGFWQPMDTLREKRVLEELWKSGAAPWKLWD